MTGIFVPSSLFQLPWPSAWLRNLVAFLPCIKQGSLCFHESKFIKKNIILNTVNFSMHWSFQCGFSFCFRVFLFFSFFSLFKNAQTSTLEAFLPLWHNEGTEREGEEEEERNQKSFLTLQSFYIWEYGVNLFTSYYSEWIIAFLRLPLSFLNL